MIKIKRNIYIDSYKTNTKSYYKSQNCDFYQKIYYVKYSNKKKEYYDQIIEYYFKQAENKIYADSVYIKPHKYFYKDTVMENRYKVNDGHLSFSPPEYFNDPFDCGKCVEVCPQNCINQETIPYVIENKHCLHCGNCLTVCRVGAVERV